MNVHASQNSLLIFVLLSFPKCIFAIFKNRHPSEALLNQFELVMNSERGVYRQLAEQEKTLIWMLRYEIRDKYDYALPLLLNAVKWDNHIDVAKVGIKKY